MDVICDKCGGSNIYVVQPEPIKEPPKKMSEVNNSAFTTAVYRLTTLRCKDCGFEHIF